METEEGPTIPHKRTRARPCPGDTVSGPEEWRGEPRPTPPPIIMLETAPTPANLIIDLIDLGEGPSGAKQGEGEETLAPPRIPEIVPINVENTGDSGVDPKTRGVTEGEVGKADPPAPGHPEGSQPRTNTLLGTGPDPGEDGAKDRPRPPPRGKGGERPNQPHQYGK